MRFKQRLAIHAASSMWLLHSTQEEGLSSLSLRVECPHTSATYINVVFRNEHSTSMSAKTYPFKKKTYMKRKISIRTKLFKLLDPTSTKTTADIAMPVKPKLVSSL